MTDFTIDDTTLNWRGVLYKNLLPREATGGAISVVDSLSPVGSGPPQHVHEAEDETFVMLTGRCKFWLEGDIFEKGPGESVYVPRGSAHTFQIIGDQPSRHLVILTPGGFEAFFTEMAEGQFNIPEDMAAIEEAAKRYNLRFTGPPLDAH
jgi:quercetin dioxygenase-like cupin family protein